MAFVTSKGRELHMYVGEQSISSIVECTQTSDSVPTYNSDVA